MLPSQKVNRHFLTYPTKVLYRWRPAYTANWENHFRTKIQPIHILLTSIRSAQGQSCASTARQAGVRCHFLSCLRVRSSLDAKCYPHSPGMSELLSLEGLWKVNNTSEWQGDVIYEASWISDEHLSVQVFFGKEKSNSELWTVLILRLRTFQIKSL